jgi:hypothetical protein
MKKSDLKALIREVIEEISADNSGIQQQVLKAKKELKIILARRNLSVSDQKRAEELRRLIRKLSTQVK